jgi:F-type H+-transporting ATPase subunit b
MTRRPCFRGRALLQHLAYTGLLVFLVAWPALAQETEPSPADSTIGWGFRWLNFAIVFAGILYFAIKICGPYFRSRKEEIARQVAEGARAREAAENLRQEVRDKLAGIGTQVAQIREEAKRSTEAEAKRLRELARREAETIEKAAEAEIAASRRNARLELKALAAGLAIDRAEVLLKQELTPEAEASLIHIFVEQLAGSAN